MEIKPKRLFARFIAALALFSILGGLLLDAELFEEITGKLFRWSTLSFGRFWQWLVLILFASTLFVALSPAGDKRLGKEAPQLGFVSWIAIILSTLLAGGGIFWSAAEPIFHLQSTPPGFAEKSADPASAALAQSYFHWGFLAWTSLGTLAILPLYKLREDKELRNRPAALLFPVLPKKWLKAWFGSAIDIVSVVSALVGTIGPIGFLGIQLGFILGKSTALPDTYQTHILIIISLAAVYTLSAVRGIKKGIRVLSIFNMLLCLVFGATILFSSHMGDLFQLSADSAALYLINFPDMALSPVNNSWTQDWTLFFWGWFLGYGPIMSIFVFKISRGRTIREIFLAIAIIAPIVTNIWFSVVGGSGILLDLTNEGSISAALSQEGMPAAMLAIIEAAQTPRLLLILVVPLIFLFMATTGDSIAISVSSIFSENEEPGKRSRIFWSVLMAAVAAAIIGFGQKGAIGLFQQTIVIASVPISILMALASISGIYLVFKILSKSSEHD